TSRGTRETVLGTLGKATTLRVPPEFQNLTRRFGEATWKRNTEDPKHKLVLLRYTEGNYTNYMKGRTRFHQVDFSLEILNTSRQDRQLYEYLVSKGPEEEVLQIWLDVFEPVSDPRIQHLSWSMANGSCTITLNCTAERGDNISYSWVNQDLSTPGLCSSTGSILHLSYPLQNTSISCSCRASNPVSYQVVTFNSSGCSYKQDDSSSLTTEQLILVVLSVVLVIIFIMSIFWRKHRARKKQEHPPLAQATGVNTIYSQVQRVERRRSNPTEHPSCTTIYAAATGQPLDKVPGPSRAPSPPSSSPGQPQSDGSP
ncbi:PREDICTED: signaling lymphocytic activation molecule, partial [Chaetura pelagica]